MVESYKKLGAIAPTDNKEYVLYATPASTQSLVSNITVTNRSSSSASFDVNVYNEGVANQNGLLVMKNFVSVESGQTAASSTDGITWTARTMPSNQGWESVAYGNNVFVAVTRYTAAAISANGVTWTATTIPNGRDGRKITYGNGTFVSITSVPATGLAISHSSTDGITWTSNAVPGGGIWQDIDFGNNIFVAVAVDFKRTVNSTNGITWVQGTLAQSGVIRVKYGNGIFVSLSSYAGVSTSTNGIIWTIRSIPTSGKAISHGNNIFVVLSDNTTTGATSTDGITWTSITIPAVSYQRAIYANNIFVAIGGGTSFSTSTNGTTWTLRSGTVSLPSSGITYGENLQTASPPQNNLYKTSAIDANETLILEPGISLSPQNSVVVKDNSSGNLTFSTYGVELS